MSNAAATLSNDRADGIADAEGSACRDATDTTALSRPDPVPEGPDKHRPGERAPYAESPDTSRGRLLQEEGCLTRRAFQRDRDRIIHSSAFRRLNHKTQVFVFHEGDHYRSRLTHTLEVAQIARAIARALLLDEDLAEAVALAHDLGHPPFGHAGERALDAAMVDCGGFDHNAQSLRVVTVLEQRYAAFDGLNLAWETLEGIAKHNGAYRPGTKHWPVPWAIAEVDAHVRLELGTQPSLEAQIAAVADDIAWLNHDLDDALRADMISMAMLEDLQLTGAFLRDVRAAHPDVPAPRLIYEINRRLITAMVMDVIAHVRGEVHRTGLASADDVRLADTWIAGFTAEMRAGLQELRAFLFDNVYREGRIARIMGDAEGLVADLFAGYLAHPGRMPEEWQARMAPADAVERGRIVGDYVAGMTDRYAILEHRRWFDRTPDLF